MRDDFPEETKRAAASRVGNCCSNPDCRAVTSGPQADPAKALNVGVAAHITAASAGGPRYDASLTPEQRRHAANAIWLCQTCAKLVDNDPARYRAELLRQWRQEAEEEALSQIGKTAKPAGLDALDSKLRRIEFLHDCSKPLMGGRVFVEFRREYTPTELGHFRLLVAILNMHEPDPHPALYLGGRDSYPAIHRGGGTTTVIGTRSLAWSRNPDDDIQDTTFSTMASATDRVEFGAHLHKRGPLVATLGNLDQRWLSVYVTKPMLEQIAGIGLIFNDYLVAGHPVDDFVILDGGPLVQWRAALSEAENAVPWATVMIKNTQPVVNLQGAERKGWSLRFDDYTPEKVR